MHAERRIHRAALRSIEPLGPELVRAVFGGDGLDGFSTTGVGDEYVRVFLPHPGQAHPVLPRPTGAEGWDFDDGVEPAPLRTYTIRAWDPVRREATIDLLVHGRGIAARWARDARPGDTIGISTPRGMYDAPADIRWQLLVADGAGLPAAFRIAEQTDAAVRTRLVLEVPDADHELAVDLPPSADVHWVHGGNGHGASRLAEIVESAELPVGPGYVWVAGETRVTRAVRRRLRHELGWPSSAYKVVGYWTENSEEWNARYEALPAEVLERIERLWDDPERDEEEIDDEYEAVLERFDL